MKQFAPFLVSIFLIANEPITPLPQTLLVHKEKAKLGKALFSDPILSKDNTISCASCHILSNGGDDNMRFSLGIEGKIGNINAPTVYNAIFNHVQFWDGRAKNLADQAKGPIVNPIEMGNSYDNLLQTLKASKYNEEFKKIYQDGVTIDNLAQVIAEFEKTLITPNSPFDRYLRGDKDAINDVQKEGYALFKSKGCISCHHGINIGGNHFNKFGVVEDINQTHLGRYNLTKREQDRYFFKVPSLRNIALTAPYFHDGRTYNLEEVVRIMAKHQLGRKITPSEVDKIVAFLHSLNGQIKPNGKEL
ncbi:MAG: cytochrome-c peroxidase [Campylobacterales bacterium]|nr:cytochrome-c peroxidase [Campylobacterales bacterium]